MLCEHGVFPHKVLALNLREKLVMFEMIKKHGQEIQKAMEK
jgi:hypothetical protein